MVGGKIQISLSKVVEGDIRDVYAVLADRSRFADWWPVPVSVSTDGPAGVTIRPLPGVRLVLRLVDSEPYRFIRYEYVRGPFRGHGEWRFERAEGGDGKTRVTYAVELRPVNRLVAVLASSCAFRWKHGRDVTRILETLGDAVRDRAPPGAR